MKTYSFGLTQATAYRALKGHTNKLLLPYGITAFDWALLGLLYEEKNGIRTTALADNLCVSKAMISKTTKKLGASGWIELSEQENKDKRAVLFVLTNKSRESMPKIEQELRNDFRAILGKVGKLDLLMYYRSSLVIAKHLKQDIDKSNLV